MPCSTSTEETVDVDPRKLFQEHLDLLEIVIEGLPGPDDFGVPPPPDDAPADAEVELVKAYYAGVVDAASALRKDATAASVAARDLREKRADTSLETERKRDDAALAVANARIDADREA